MRICFSLTVVEKTPDFSALPAGQAVSKTRAKMSCLGRIIGGGRLAKRYTGKFLKRGRKTIESDSFPSPNSSKFSLLTCDNHSKNHLWNSQIVCLYEGLCLSSHWESHLLDKLLMRIF